MRNNSYKSPMTAYTNSMRFQPSSWQCFNKTRRGPIIQLDAAPLAPVWIPFDSSPLFRISDTEIVTDTPWDSYSRYFDIDSLNLWSNYRIIEIENQPDIRKWTCFLWVAAQHWNHKIIESLEIIQVIDDRLKPGRTKRRGFFQISIPPSIFLSVNL